MNADDPGKPHLELCLMEMETAASISFAPGVMDKLFEMSIDKFNTNAPKWPAASDKVRRAATFAGQLAARCAVFGSDGTSRPTISLEHAVAALAAVRLLCKAERTASDPPRFLWCPDIPHEQ